MSVLFLGKLGVCCLEASSEEEFCEQIARVCELLQPAAEKCTEEERRQELALLNRQMSKK